MSHPSLKFLTLHSEYLIHKRIYQCKKKPVFFRFFKENSPHDQEHKSKEYKKDNEKPDNLLVGISDSSDKSLSRPL